MWIRALGCPPRSRAQAKQSPGLAGHHAGPWLREQLYGCDRIPPGQCAHVGDLGRNPEARGPSGPRTEPADAEQGQRLPHWRALVPSPLLTHFSFPICSLLSILLSSLILLPPLCASSPFLSSKLAAQASLVPIHSASPPPALPAATALCFQGLASSSSGHRPSLFSWTVTQVLRETAEARGPAGALAQEGCRARVRGYRGRGFSSAAQPRGEGA